MAENKEKPSVADEEKRRLERKDGHREMMTWWCAKPGNAEKLPCMHMKLRDAPSDRPTNGALTKYCDKLRAL